MLTVRRKKRIMAISSSTAALNELRADLHRAGLRATASRIAVLQFLRDCERPVSHAEAVAALADQPWDKTTVYRNLVDLVRSSLARKTELGDRVWRYEAVDTVHSSSDHPHFVCTECGNVQCLTDVKVTMTTAGKGPRAVRDRQVEFQIRGCCDQCR